jgi:hypothetical protein
MEEEVGIEIVVYQWGRGIVRKVGSRLRMESESSCQNLV